MTSSQYCVQISSSSKTSCVFSFLSPYNPKAWITSFARSSILSGLRDAITVGHLTISDSQGAHYYGTYQKDCNDVHLQVIDDNFWVRILLSGDLGFSEAFMIGDVEVSSLKGAIDWTKGVPKI